MATQSVPGWVQSLGELTAELRRQDGTKATLAVIVDGAVTMVPGARWAGVTVTTTDGEIEVEASTNPVVVELAAAQVALGEGPCTGVLRRHRNAHIADMATDARWPRFGRAALDRGVGSALMFRLFVDQHRVGALTLYAGESGVFAADSLVVGDVLAQHASLAMVGAAAEDQFNQALASRDVIGQAKGLLMHQRQLSGLQAFQLMVRASQDGNVKLVEIARWVVEQHETSVQRTYRKPR